MHEDHKTLLSIPTAIIVGSFIISISILISGGIITPKGVKTTANNAVSAAAQPTAVPTIKPVTMGKLPILGNPTAKVTIVEFADYQCPFCGAVSGFQPNSDLTLALKKQDPAWLPYESGIIEDYVKSGKVKFAYRDFTFLGQESFDSANAARCAAEQNKFWEYHDKLFTLQNGENKGTFAKDNLKKFASDLGLDTTKFNSCVDTNKYLADVKIDTDEGKASGVSGTPGLFVNGKYIEGARSYSIVKDAIEAALKS